MVEVVNVTDMKRRDEILAAAAHVFAQHGFRGSTTRRIADTAGVNEITLFRQFGSKEELIRQAMQYCSQFVGFTPLPDVAVDPDKELTAWSESYIRYLRLQSSMIRKTMSEIEERPEMSEMASTVPRKASADLCRYLTGLKRQGFIAEKFDAKTAAAMLMGSIFADAVGRDMMSDVYPPEEKAAQMYTRLLLKGIGVEIGGRRTTHKQTKRTKQLSA
jgi:AcrR family transcriptional regulator